MAGAYSDMMGVANASPQPSAQPPGSFSGITQPGTDVNVIATPASSPADLEQRKTGWAALWERFQTDPNLQRAIGLMGAHMAQPIPYGGTVQGNLGQSMNLGQQALNAGDYASYQQKRQAALDAQKAAESAANIESTKAGTEQTKAGTPGVKARSDVAVATTNAAIQKVRDEADKASLALTTAKSEEAVAKIERDLRKRKGEIAVNTPDAKLATIVAAELDAPLQQAALRKAQIVQANAAAGASAAAAKKSGVDTEKDQITVDVLKAMSKEEQKQFLTKTGKYSATTSALSQQATLWGDLYEKLPTADPHRTGKTKEQFVMDRLSASKQKDAMELLVKAKQAGMSDEEIDSLGLLDMAKSAAAERKGAAGGITKMVYDRATNSYKPATAASAPIAPAKAATSTASRLPVTPASPSVVPAEHLSSPEGNTLDAAIKMVAAAQEKVRSYSQTKRRQDPQGYTKAKEELAQTIQARSEAETAYLEATGSNSNAAFSK